jgi:hypothetical protein
MLPGYRPNRLMETQGNIDPIVISADKVSVTNAALRN